MPTSPMLSHIGNADQSRSSVWMRNWTDGLILFMAASIPLPTAWSTSGLVALLLTFFLSASWKSKFATLRQFPLALAALSLCALLLLGTLYTEANVHDVVSRLGKYYKLLVIPVVIYFVAGRNLAQRALWFFMGSMSVILCLAYLSFYTGITLLPVSKLFHIEMPYFLPYSPQVFNDHITSSLLFSFVFYVACVRALFVPRYRYVFMLLAVLSLHLVLFMATGRTGLVVSLCLVGLMGVHVYRHGSSAYKWGWGLFVVGLGLSLNPQLLNHKSQLPSHPAKKITSEPRSTKNLPHSEIVTVAHNLSSYFKGEKNTSTGQRLDFYRLSWKTMTQHPGALHWLIGLGTGSFVSAYEQVYLNDNGLHKLPMATHNPHNQYLELLVQLGVLGLGALLFLYFCMYRYSTGAFALSEYLVQGLVLILIVDSFLNTALMDYKTGIFFVFMAALFAGKRGESSHSAADNRLLDQ
jgi:O-antigen ligase